MGNPAYGEGYTRNPAENYQRYFVPSIGRPSAAGLIEAAALAPGERVLDVACGTGVVTRLAFEEVTPGGRVVGLDRNPAMLAVARASTPDEAPIEWIEALAEDMPLDDASFDVALCGMGLQFFEDREAGLREMRRVLAPDGRAVFNLPGPIPEVFEAFERGLARHCGPEVAAFASAVFSLHERDEIEELLRRAGFAETAVESATGALKVPPPREFLWQYVHSTPLAGPLGELDEEGRAAFEQEVCRAWEAYAEDDGLRLEVRMTTAVGYGT